MKKLLFLSIFLSFCSAKTAFSQMSGVIGKNLLAMCNDDILACRAFIVAVIDTANLIDASEDIQCSQFKIPKDITLDHIKDIIVKDLKNDIENQKHSAVFSVLSSLHIAFPCPSK